MKFFIFSLLFIFIDINCQNPTENKELFSDIEVMAKKMLKIDSTYLKLVEQNKDNLVLIDNEYFYKSLYNQEIANSSDEKKFDARLILKDGKKEIYLQIVPLYKNAREYYFFENKEKIEMVRLPNKWVENNTYTQLEIFNYRDHININYYPSNKQCTLNFYRIDEDGRKITSLTQFYKFGKLVSSENLLKDFKVSRKEMFQKLANNFYEPALKYIDEKQIDGLYNSPNPTAEGIENFKDLVKSVRNAIIDGVKNKNGFYRKIAVLEIYENNIPTYKIDMPKSPEGKYYNWTVLINAIDNSFVKISYIPYEF